MSLSTSIIFDSFSTHAEFVRYISIPQTTRRFEGWWSIWLSVVHIWTKKLELELGSPQTSTNILRKSSSSILQSHIAKGSMAKWKRSRTSGPFAPIITSLYSNERATEPLRQKYRLQGNYPPTYDSIRKFGIHCIIGIPKLEISAKDTSIQSKSMRCQTTHPPRDTQHFILVQQIIMNIFQAHKETPRSIKHGLLWLYQGFIYPNPWKPLSCLKMSRSASTVYRT